jgi:hypothetical protein
MIVSHTGPVLVCSKCNECRRRYHENVNTMTGLSALREERGFLFGIKYRFSYD